MAVDVWYAVPSAREHGGTLRQWKDRGYRVACWRDLDNPLDWADICIVSKKYPGYAIAVNTLCRYILSEYPETRWIVTGGDDVLPDPEASPQMIASECDAHFGGTFGVMQPTGDRWGHPLGGGKTHVYSENVCSYPWMGAEFCRRMYGGDGPLFDGYYHMFVDEELQGVAKKLGVLWQRRDIIHKHEHWGRTNGGADRRNIPAFLQYVNSPQHWNEAGKLFKRRESAGFPGHEPITV